MVEDVLRGCVERVRCRVGWVVGIPKFFGRSIIHKMFLHTECDVCPILPLT